MGGQMLPPQVRLPPTPESPAEPTFLPHVREPLTFLSSSSPSFNTLNESTNSNSFNNVSISSKSESCGTTSSLLTGLNILLHSRDALVNLHTLYATSPTAQLSFNRAVFLVAQSVLQGGKLVVSGVGKSAKIAQKLVATCNSLQVRAAFLHATEAVHGDLGMLGPRDTLLVMSFSGTTPEVLSMMPHVPPSLAVIGLTGWGAAQGWVTGQLGDEQRQGMKGLDDTQRTDCSRANACPLFTCRQDECENVLLQAPIPVSETAAFGVPAPTTSTTVAMALGDALALAVAQELHERPAEVFRRCHPGGSIGAAKR